MRLRRLIGALSVGLLATFAAIPAPASAADDYLVMSDPQPRQELKDVPGWVTLAFRTAASAKLAKIIVLDASGRNVTTGALIVEGTNVTTQLEFELPKGTYSVYYRTSDSSGEPRGGAFQFAYGKGNWTALDKEVWVGEEEQPPVIANPDPNATQPATEVPTDQPATPTPDPTSSAPAPGTTAPPTGPGTPSGSGGSAMPWFIGGGALLLAAAGLGGWRWWRTTRGTPES